MSGRMNWDRVNRENRAYRAARSAPSGTWERDDSWGPYGPREVGRWPRAEARRWRPKTEDKDPTVSRGMGTSNAARQRRRRGNRAGIERRHAQAPRAADPRNVGACPYGYQRKGYTR